MNFFITLELLGENWIIISISLAVFLSFFFYKNLGGTSMRLNEFNKSRCMFIMSEFVYVFPTESKFDALKTIVLVGLSSTII